MKAIFADYSIEDIESLANMLNTRLNQFILQLKKLIVFRQESLERGVGNCFFEDTIGADDPNICTFDLCG